MEEDKRVGVVEEIDIEMVAKWMGEDGKLRPPEDYRPHGKWPRGWRMIDPNAGRRFVVGNVMTAEKKERYSREREELIERFPQKEGEDEEGYELRLQLISSRSGSMWKPGESGNPGGLKPGTRKPKPAPTMGQALRAALAEEIKYYDEEAHRVRRMTKGELLNRQLVNAIVTGKVEFPSGSAGVGAENTKKRTLVLNEKQWLDAMFRLLKVAVPQGLLEEQTETVKSVVFDMNMLPDNAKVKIVQKVTGAKFIESAKEDELEDVDVDELDDVIDADYEEVDYGDGE